MVIIILEEAFCASECQTFVRFMDYCRDPFLDASRTGAKLCGASGAGRVRNPVEVVV